MPPKIMYHYFRNRLGCFLAYSNQTSLNEALMKKNGYWLTNLPNCKFLKCLQYQKRNLSQTPLIDKPSTKPVHIFVDNSNLWNEGKYTVGNLEQLGTFDLERSSFYFKQLRVDYGRLLTTVQCGRKLGSAPFLVGSQPPSNDSLWPRIKDQGFEVNVFDWDIKSHSEKEARIELAVTAVHTITHNDPGILILVAGDSDYKPLVKLALEYNWIVETWFWNLGASSSLKLDTNFYPLDNYYRSFSYGLGPDFSEENLILEISDGNSIHNLKNENLLEWFSTLNLFGWWNWISYRAVQLYFNNSEYLEMVKNWILHNYQEVRVQEKNLKK